jgi:hypothetical protein
MSAPTEEVSNTIATTVDIAADSWAARLAVVVQILWRNKYQRE